MPVIFTGTGRESGAGSAFICMPLWQVAVFCAAAVRTSPKLATIQSAAVQVARRDTGHASDERSMSLLLTYNF
jgi:hypothetical protein